MAVAHAGLSVTIGRAQDPMMPPGILALLFRLLFMGNGIILT
ncbi:hypothetical protein [Sodalis glossinidius]|nr:hypothetical protein [Sodalis glossinidius]